MISPEVNGRFLRKRCTRTTTFIESVGFQPMMNVTSVRMVTATDRIIV